MDDDEMREQLDRWHRGDDLPSSGHGGPLRSSYAGAMRHLTSMMAGVASDLRGILDKLRQKDDPDIQRIALEEFAQMLLMANEDTLAGHFAPDPFVKELIILMQPNAFGEENPETMLVACRCIANMMEALPASTANVVYGGAVPILCQKLLEIHYIDLAEQALSVSLSSLFLNDILTLSRRSRRYLSNFPLPLCAKAV
jgi:E3 ubiquitin-protein ligase TRIP12